jgi:hypothetical protein
MVGTYVGIVERTGEHVLVGKNGRAVRVRTVRRAPIQERWAQGLVLEMKATPRHPDPTTKSRDIEPVLGEEPQAPEAPIPDVIYQKVPRMHDPREFDTRELRLTRRLLDKFGYAPECEGCIAIQGDFPKRKHRASCRERMYRAINADPDERRLLDTALARMASRGEAGDMAEEPSAAAASRPGAPRPTDSAISSDQFPA